MFDTTRVCSTTNPGNGILLHIIAWNGAKMNRKSARIIETLVTGLLTRFQK
jgi:hypothetical protein